MVTYGGMKVAEPILAADLEDEPRRASGIRCSTCLQLGNDTKYPVDALTVVRHWKINSNPADLIGGGHWWWYCAYHASVSPAEWTNDRNAPEELHPVEWPGLVTVDGSSVVAEREDREGRGLTEFDIKKNETICPNCFTVRAADGSCLCGVAGDAL